MPGAGGEHLAISTLPQNLDQRLSDPEAEKALLGCLLLGEVEVQEKALQCLDVSLFSDPARKAIASILLERLSNGEPTDLTQAPAIVEECERKGLEVGFEDLLGLTQHAIGGFEFSGLATRLGHLRQRRHVLRIGDRLRAAALSSSPDLDGLLTEALSEVGAVSSPKRRGLETMSARDLLTRDLPPRKDVVQDIITEGGLALLAGLPASGKSMLVAGLAVAVVRGEPWLGFKTQACPIIWASAEGADHLIRERLTRIVQGNLTGLENLHCWWPTHGNLRLEQAEDRAELIASCLEKNAKLVILDPLIRFHALAENDTAAMGELVRAIADVRTRAGAAIVLVHHLRKPSADKTRHGSGTEMRGSSVLHGETDSIMLLEQRRNEGDHVLYWEMRWAKEPPPFILSLDEDTLTFNFEGFFQPRERKVSESAALHHLERLGEVTVKEFAEELKVGDKTARTYLKELHDKGLADYYEGPRGVKIWRAVGGR